ncbi:MAG: sterol desaturase family protein [Actinobacteria bacterium]|nr:sterol desaturase family protein [Actinomycetota bacterium]
MARSARLGERGLAVALHGGVVAIAGVGAAVHRALKPRHPRAAELVLPVGVAVAWATIHRLERTRPFHEDWQEDHDDLRPDLAFLALSSVPYVVGTALGTLAGRRVRRSLGLGRLPTSAAVSLSLLGYELFHTTYHRLGHEWGPLWKLHSVHHSATRLYWLNATRFHWAELTVETFAEALLAPVWGLRPHQHVAHSLVRATYGQLQHANVAVDSGPLNRIFATPDLHRWHHSEVYEEGDTNYGAVLSIWDQLLGSWFWPGRQLDSEIGVGRMPRFPSTWADLQRVPLRWEAIKADNADTWYAAPAPRVGVV